MTSQEIENTSQYHKVTVIWPTAHCRSPLEYYSVLMYFSGDVRSSAVRTLHFLQDYCCLCSMCFWWDCNRNVVGRCERVEPFVMLWSPSYLIHSSATTFIPSGGFTVVVDRVQHGRAGLWLCSFIRSELRCTASSNSCQSWPAVNFSHADPSPTSTFTQFVGGLCIPVDKEGAR